MISTQFPPSSGTHCSYNKTFTRTYMSLMFFYMFNVLFFSSLGIVFIPFYWPIFQITDLTRDVVNPPLLHLLNFSLWLLLFFWFLPFYSFFCVKFCSLPKSSIIFSMILYILITIILMCLFDNPKISITTRRTVSFTYFSLHVQSVILCVCFALIVFYNFG